MVNELKYVTHIKQNPWWEYNKIKTPQTNYFPKNTSSNRNTKHYTNVSQLICFVHFLFFIRDLHQLNLFFELFYQLIKSLKNSLILSNLRKAQYVFLFKLKNKTKKLGRLIFLRIILNLLNWPCAFKNNMLLINIILYFSINIL